MGSSDGEVQTYVGVGDWGNGGVVKVGIGAERDIERSGPWAFRDETGFFVNDFRCWEYDLGCRQEAFEDGHELLLHNFVGHSFVVADTGEGVVTVCVVVGAAPTLWAIGRGG